jgi:Domain of unknown function (DUF4034)
LLPPVERKGNGKDDCGFPSAFPAKDVDSVPGFFDTNGMKSPKLAASPWIGLIAAGCFSLFTLTACKKSDSTSPRPKLSTEEARQQRLAWNRQTLREAYDKIGNRSPEWDGFAQKALDDFAQVRALHSEESEFKSQLREMIVANCAKALTAGCDDPMIAYLNGLYAVGEEDANVEVLANTLCKAADNLNASAYPAIRKFYAADRAARKVKLTVGNNSTPPELHYYRKLAINNLTLALQDKSIPVEEAYAACDSLHQVLTANKNELEQFYFQVEKILFRNWPDASFPWLLKGQFYTDYAWAARGGGDANTVTEEGWKLFAERLAVAEESLNRAWELNPKDVETPIAFLKVELGQSKGRERMELWFQRAMALDPNNYDACYKKLYYLEPKWYGSEEALLDFGRECVQSKEWGGRVPLILLDAHLAIRRYYDKPKQDDYWKLPEVWPDIQAAFDRFFELNPGVTKWYQNYAWYAYLCGQWDKFNELIPKLGRVNYSYFGGIEKFEEMVRLANERAGNKNSTRQ